MAREHPQFFVEDFRRYSDGMVKSPYARRAVDVGEMIKRGVIEKVQRPPELAPRNTRCFGTEFNTKQIWGEPTIALTDVLRTLRRGCATMTSCLPACVRSFVALIACLFLFVR